MSEERIKTNYCVQCKEYADELDRLRAELAQTQAKAEKLAEAGNKLFSVSYHDNECPIITSGAYCNCEADAAADTWNQALTEWSAK